MSAQKLITEHLDLWTGAVTKKSTSGRGSNGKVELTGVKKLRELILELAVEGRLVHHDSNDKPASELLQAAADEKAQALKDKKIRKSQLGDPGSVLSENDVPDGWAFTTLSAIGYWAIGNGFPKAHQGETGLEVLFCKVSDMNLPENSREIHTTVNSVSEQTAHSLKLNIHSSGTVIFPKIGGAISTNKRRVIIKPTAIDNNCLGITPTCAISSAYLYLFLTSVDMTQYQVGTSVPALSQGTLGKIPIKLPPLKEQHRIVQKVDELMALCDRLEQQTSDQLDAHETLVDTLLGTLTQSENATELADNWARLAAHFDTLFTTEQSIDKLKQAILQLAVMGRLVEQDAGDEPASVLLGKLNDSRVQVLANKKTRAAGKIKPVTSEDQPFHLPTGWAWCRFEQLIDPQFSISYGVLVPGADATEGVPLIRVADLSLSPQQSLPEKRISPDVDMKHAKTRLVGGEILLCVVGSIGKIGIAPRSWKGANIARAICRLKPSPLISKEYLLLLLQTDLMQKKFGADTRTLAQPTLNVGLIKVAETPLPPIAEQHRIVQKVDELMALCDQLKERLSQASETRCQLAEAVVERGLST